MAGKQFLSVRTSNPGQLGQNVNQLIQIIVQRDLRLRGENLFVENDSQER